MALNKGLKANHVMHCLDLNIPPDNDEFASICRGVFKTCVRDTEKAEGCGVVLGVAVDMENRESKGLGKGVWGLIEEKELAKSVRMGDGLHGKIACGSFWGGRMCWSVFMLYRFTVACRGSAGPDPGRDRRTRPVTFTGSFGHHPPLSAVAIARSGIVTEAGTEQELIHEARETVEALTIQI